MVNPLKHIIPWLAVISTQGCVHVAQIHPRADENNQVCTEYLARGDLNKAEIYCDLALQFAPQYANVWNNKGLIAYKRGQLSVAKECYIKALRYNQELAQAYNNLGVIYLHHEKAYGTAHDNFQRALKVNPDYNEARYNLALTFVRMGKKDLARKEYQTVLAVNANLADPHNDLGLLALEEKNYPEAITHLSKAVELSPGFAEAWSNLGLAYSEAGKFQEAKDAFASCLEADPENIVCRNNAPIINRKAALLEPTLKEAKSREAIEKTPAGMLSLARQYKERGLKNEEERTYMKCLRLDPKYASCHYGLFELFREDQRKPEALIACKNFLKFSDAADFPKEVEACEKFVSR